MIYHFPQPGGIPGVPGHFTGHVTISLDGQVITEATFQETADAPTTPEETTQTATPENIEEVS